MDYQQEMKAQGSRDKPVSHKLAPLKWLSVPSMGDGSVAESVIRDVVQGRKKLPQYKRLTYRDITITPLTTIKSIAR